MKKLCFALLTASLLLSCGSPKPTNSYNSANNQTNSVGIQPQTNSNSALSTSNQNSGLNGNSTERLEMMKQIENQQLEDAKKSPSSNRNTTTKTPPSSKTSSTQRQTF